MREKQQYFFALFQAQIATVSLPILLPTNTGRCTIYVQYLYNICTFTNCTSIVQVLYIYCTTDGVGMARIWIWNEKNFTPIVRFWGACTLYSYTNINLHSYETRKKAFSNVFSGRNGHFVRMQRRRTDTAGTTTAAAAGQCGTGRLVVGVKFRERLYISGRYDARRPAVDARLHRSDQR